MNQRCPILGTFSLNYYSQVSSQI